MTRRADSSERADTAAKTEFLVSFLVDARGGTMTACRKGGSNTNFYFSYSRFHIRHDRLSRPPQINTTPIRFVMRL
jgi:hypothetical protein